MDMRALIRRAILGGSGVLFPAIAIAGAIWPRAVAAQYAVVLGSVDALNQFRAVYFGFWIGIGVLMLTAARRTDLPVLARMGGLLLVLQACGRILSVLVDGMPSLPFQGALVLELVAGVAVLATLPRPAPATAAAR